MRNHGLSASILLAALAAAPLFGQLSQYNPPGGRGAAETPPETDLRQLADAARWHLGPIGVDPKIELREIAYVDPGGNAEADVTASVAAGVRFYLPVGSHLLFTAHALPEYIWWKKNGENRRWGGESGLGLLLRGGRLSAEVRVQDSNVNAFLTPEVDQRAQVEGRSIESDVELAVLRRVGLFVAGTRGHFQGRDLATGTTPELANLDRRESWLDGGVRWHPSSTLTIGVGTGRSRVEFDDRARDRSNEGRSTVANLAWDTGKLNAAVQARRVSLDGLAGSELDHFTGTTGAWRAGWSPRPTFQLAVYGSRDLTYSVLAASAFFLDHRTGFDVGTRLGHRLGVRFFRESGERKFPGLGVDDVESDGASADLTVRRLSFHLYGRRTQLDGVNGKRTTRELAFGVSLGKFKALWY
jgi:hypothetical protein